MTSCEGQVFVKTSFPRVLAAGRWQVAAYWHAFLPIDTLLPPVYSAGRLPPLSFAA
jgi:hypothetical protein